ncbi:CEP104 isoform 8, partial [Pongo abelii]
RLGRYEVEKRCAVEKEDYDLAKEKKQQMEQYRTEVYEQLELHSLLDAELHSAVDQLLPATDPHPKINAESLPYDERPLPAIRKHHGEAVVEPEMSNADISDARRGGILGEPEPLTEKALREASSAIDVLGETLVAGAYSKTWS